MKLKIRSSERQVMLMRSFLEAYPSEEVLDVLYHLYRAWAYQMSVKTNREERLRILSCYSELKDLLEEMAKLQQEITKNQHGKLK